MFIIRKSQGYIIQIRQQQSSITSFIPYFIFTNRRNEEQV
ncbi:hypothetical protein pb186bvf_018320 [Paramecium bursaria]